MAYTPGPGDLFPEFAGHPHDPRTPEDDINDTTEDSILLALIAVRSAARAYTEGKPKEAESLLVCARNMINELLGQKREHV